MGCDIIIPVWNQLELTRDCIEYLVRNTRYPYRLVIIDNGSEKQTEEYLKELSRDNKLKVSLIRNETNLGFVKAVNQGLEISGADYVCLLNNDVLVSEGWLSEMVDVAESDTKIGIVNPDNKEVNSGSMNELLRYKSESLKKCPRRFTEVMAAMGFCMLIKRELILKIGLLDEIFGLGGWDDMDYSRRAWQAGYKCIAAKRSFVVHRVHSSFNSLGKVRKRQVARQTRALFWRKWGQIPRIAFIINKSLDNESLFNKVYNNAHNLARNWNMVSFFLRESAISFEPRHESITLVKYPDRLFLLRCLRQIVQPKKKRLMFKTVFVDDAGLLRLLRTLYFIHRARVVLI